MERKGNDEGAPKKGKAVEQQKVRKETVVYMGPSINGVIETGTAMNDKYPDRFAEILKSNSYFSGLLIPVGKLNDAKKELRRQGSELDMLYKQAIRIIGGNNV